MKGKKGTGYFFNGVSELGANLHYSLRNPILLLCSYGQTSPHRVKIWGQVLIC